MIPEQQESFSREFDGATEEWRPVRGYEKYYIVSSFGRVVSLPRGYRENPKVLTYKKDAYPRVTLFGDDKKPRTKFVHRLVAEAFIPNPMGLPEVNHIDEDKYNPCVWNLEWVTKSQNCNYGSRKSRIREKQLNNVHPTPVVQKDKHGNVIARYPSVSEVPRATCGRFKRSNIQHALAGEMPFAYGFAWEYERKGHRK